MTSPTSSSESLWSIRHIASAIERMRLAVRHAYAAIAEAELPADDLIVTAEEGQLPKLPINWAR